MQIREGETGNLIWMTAVMYMQFPENSCMNDRINIGCLQYCNIFIGDKKNDVKYNNSNYVHMK